MYEGMDTYTVLQSICKKLVVVVAWNENQKDWKTGGKKAYSTLRPFGTF